ncbi:hypothetical protein CL176_02390 [Suicoccus acidiformans]|uniref:Phosphatase n=1 Tax=Suicoccus acidiformans TaxID=2036206 RepID=A0A347WIQ9_9LACT|nr:HAD family phosphatase [Suicoccus acidiformans]AXY24966.1 hypothetical protein CL176_02390 [Suicoccus acidiformans]
MYKAFIFDMDGVIVDSEKIYTEAIYNVALKEGFELREEYIYNFTGTTHEFTWENIKSDYNLSKSIKEYIAEMFKEVGVIKEAKGVEAYPGVVDFLKRLSAQQYKIAIASSSPLNAINEVVDLLKIREYFDILVSGEFFEKSKPDPTIYLETAKYLGVSPAECLVIEDSHNGVKAAKDAGMYCYGFIDAKYPTQDLSLADEFVESFDEIKLNEGSK